MVGSLRVGVLRQYLKGVGPEAFPIRYPLGLQPGGGRIAVPFPAPSIPTLIGEYKVLEDSMVSTSLSRKFISTAPVPPGALLLPNRAYALTWPARTITRQRSGFCLSRSYTADCSRGGAHRAYPKPGGPARSETSADLN